MKKLALISLVLLVLPMVTACAVVDDCVNCMEEYPYYPPSPYIDPYNTGDFGGSDYYAVVFDGEGEAAVIAKIGVKNFEETSLEQLVVKIPGESVRMIAAYQLTWNGYEKIKFTSEKLQDATEFAFNLSVPTSSEGITELVLYYKAEGYATGSNGAFDFDFETIQYGADSEQVTVSINVQDGYYFNGVKSKVENLGSFNEMRKAVEDDSMGARMDVAMNSAYFYEGYVKIGTLLDPWESFHVSGKYADAEYKLYLWQIIAGVSIGALVLVSAAVFIRKRMK